MQREIKSWLQIIQENFGRFCMIFLDICYFKKSVVRFVREDLNLVLSL